MPTHTTAADALRAMPAADAAQRAPVAPGVAPAAGTGDAERPDVLVVGGGPAGSTIATLLARKGWRVTMLEKARHPRFHIGESLLPLNVPILERLGVLEQVRAIGVLKAGADFPNDDGSYNVFRFRDALDAKVDYAFHVKREEFDQLLFEHARANGVDAREAVKVERIETDAAGRPALVHATGPDGALRFAPRHVVDCSGRDAWLGSRLGLKRRNPRHASAAVFSHYEGVRRREGDDAGNISIYRHAHGWAWLIPLRDGTTSVGAVCFPDYLKTRQGDTEGFLHRTLQTIPELAQRMGGARRVAPVHVTGNYAYDCSRMHGPGWTLVGDAYSFVDPMFSSGVYLAMHGAEQAAGTLDAVLRAPAEEARLQGELQRRLDAGLDEFKWFIYRFTSPTMQALFAHPRNVLQVEQAVVSMLAGDVFDARPVLRRLRVFRALYALSALRMAPRALRGWLRRRRQVRMGFEGETLQMEHK
jgi:flavin-dependent dehydrogenase